MAPEFLDLFLLVHTPTASCPIIGATKEIVFGNQDPAKKNKFARVSGIIPFALPFIVTTPMPTTLKLEMAAGTQHT